MLGYLKNQSATSSSLDFTLRFPNHVTITPNENINAVIDYVNHIDRVYLRPYYPILEVNGEEFNRGVEIISPNSGLPSFVEVGTQITIRVA